MRNILRIFILASFISLTACESFLGDNVNPNEATSATPELVLPNALVSSANLFLQYSYNAMWINGYTVNAGGYGGWGAIVTYNMTTTSYNTLWSSTYDDLVNYQYIEDQSAEEPGLAYFNAVAKTMKAFDYAMLVDVFGDVPYSEGLKGAINVTPAYDSQTEVYKDLVSQLNIAIDIFTNAKSANSLGSADVIFGGSVSKWAKFANTIKLRMLLKMAASSETSAFATTEFAAMNTTVGFMTEDAKVNPGYIATAGKQNPLWERYHSNAAGTLSGSGRSAIPSKYVYSFYNGTKITDTGRGAVTYRSFNSSTPVGQLGNLVDNPDALASQTAWFVGTGTGTNAVATNGLLKGRTAGFPIMLAAESYLLQAEAFMKGFLVGDDLKAFDNGVTASFRYLYGDISGALPAGKVLATEVATYKADNPANYLVNYNLASTSAEKLEAIITQKYIANNFVNGHESWADFRRTGYPKIVNGSANPVLSFASILSSSPRADKLPVRYLYASSEFQLNPANVPTGIDQFSSLVFWQAQ
ncbi:SusD-like starch-binding protein associating with outer membrane [Algoriphagus ratkowskyi]|uniref:SusD-like starch-binding protein associating with outer membrane n=1 Tax=Algoriphagus ratkowskyi TaxID=57028 RepID=A0A2W7RK44_9BACT|nr:SusD/RagB family nutrient-binding outer membrane lipoprotein [Algoriphagus ratkowskyi]PZX55957.1 SusD-like starch-binding protein associating with outer membrane [Algoriphagus ratkowskyi]TXD77230.1 SusD/RagB family nutrient-binding outer membrane lipoprotein [Algoriphagus ratkowskyi]